MTEETRPLPPAGWYADPERPDQMRYWTGTQWWTQRWEHAGTVSAPSLPRPVGRGFAVLSAVIGVALVLTLLTLAAQAGLYVWGVTMVDDAIAAGDLDRLSTFDDLDRSMSILTGALTVVAGIAWMVWQYLLARSVPRGELARPPAMHGWSWAIPFGSMWLPFQNVRDLWRHFVPGRSAGWIRVWWACWLVFGVLTWITSRSEANVSSVASFKTLVSVEAAADVVGLVAAVLAVRLLRALTTAGSARSAVPLSPGGSPDAW